jgi:YVTN family beta-propeller protein
VSQGFPSGTVTFLFTDIEGSTRLLKELGRDRYEEALAEQQRILRAAFTAHQGQVVDTQGDSFFVAFRTAADAAAAAVDAQRGLAAHSWPEDTEVNVRTGLHTGEPKVGAERYIGIGVHRAARIGAAGHGGQVLVSNATRELVEDDLPDDVSVRDLGTYRLKDLDRPEHLFQLDAEGLPSEFPPLNAERLVPPHPLRRRALLAAGLMGVIAAAVAIPIFAFGQNGSGVTSVEAAAGNSAGLIEPGSNRLVANVDVGTTPTGVAVGEGAVWVTNASDGTVTRIDPATRTVRQTIRVGSGPSGIAVGGGAVWVVNGAGGTVSRIDPGTNDVVQTTEVGNAPAGIAVGAGAVWVGNASDQTVSKIDAKTGDVTRALPVGAAATELAVAQGTVWMTSSQSRTVSRIDPGSGEVVETINVGGGPTGLAAAGNAVWVANSLDGTVSRIDAATNGVIALVEVGNGPVSIAAGRGAVWVSNEFGRTISRIDPATNRPVDTVLVGNRPVGIALAGEAPWVAVRATGAVHRGGTLKVASERPLDSLDPAIAYDANSAALLAMTGDGLTGPKRAGGSEGNQLVPDLAVSLPTPTNGGKTYTFTLRRGIRYSTGAAVHPKDVRASIERLFRVGSPGAGYFERVVGAARCAKRRKACNLSHGIVVNDASGAVTFHLTAPDPDLLYKLGHSFAYVLPASTPPRPTRTRPLPATGPYMIAAYRPGHLATLVRNPRFREWSHAAQPDGYPDRIEVRLDMSADDAVNAVEQGRADEFGGFTEFPVSRVQEVTTRYAGQLHSNPRTATIGLFLNTRVPPFDDPRARRAVAYAVDRAVVVKALGGPGAVRATCQILPPNFPGYRRYCPFVGPDLARARELVTASGTKGMRVTVWGWRRLFTVQARYAASVLRRLGYRVRLRLLGGGYWNFVADSRNRAQIGTIGFIADYPAAAAFFAQYLSCRSFVVASTSNNNHAEFCDPSIDAAIRQALAVQVTNPQATIERWARIDRRVTDAAPWVPLVTPVATSLVSKRVGNYQFHTQLGPLYGQLWVR